MRTSRKLLPVLVVVAVVTWLLVSPLRRSAVERQRKEESAERAELEALKEAKYHEIRDAELDRRTGKLSDDDWEALDAQLRAEAVEILKRLDAASDEAGRT